VTLTSNLWDGTTLMLCLIVEAMRIAYADRSEYLGDPDFIKVPVKQLTSRTYAAKGVSKSAWIRHDHQVRLSQ